MADDRGASVVWSLVSTISVASWPGNQSLTARKPGCPPDNPPTFGSSRNADRPQPADGQPLVPAPVHVLPSRSISATVYRFKMS